jgi:hypothetical protein
MQKERHLDVKVSQQLNLQELHSSRIFYTSIVSITLLLAQSFSLVSWKKQHGFYQEDYTKLSLAQVLESTYWAMKVPAIEQLPKSTHKNTHTWLQLTSWQVILVC